MHMIRLRREFGFNCDLSARGECAIQFQDYSEAIVVSMVILEFQATGDGQIELHVYGQIDLDHHGVALVTSMLTLRIPLNGSCLVVGNSTLKLMATFRDIRITERVRFWVLCDGECKMLEHGYGEAWVTSMFQGECAIQFQDYSEAIVVSMVILEFQATGPR
ncbi:Atypical Kinase Coq8A [Manis pentadactyla]|nr:Atypical Kinase Coq8A [Manis pentadactyla]